MQGKGGGKAESAQASGTNIAGLKQAIETATSFANSKLNVSAGNAPSAKAEGESIS